jgi:hypothetical protein
MKSIELIGIVDENHRLHIDDPISINGPNQVKVIVLIPGEGDEADEKEWIKAAAKNPAFDFLREPNEDIYTLRDGKEFCNKG